VGTAATPSCEGCAFLVVVSRADNGHGWCVDDRVCVAGSAWEPLHETSAGQCASYRRSLSVKTGNRDTGSAVSKTA